MQDHLNSGACSHIGRCVLSDPDKSSFVRLNTAVFKEFNEAEINFLTPQRKMYVYQVSDEKNE